MIDQKLIIENPTLIQEKLAKKENLELSKRNILSMN